MVFSFYCKYVTSFLADLELQRSGSPPGGNFALFVNKNYFQSTEKDSVLSVNFCPWLPSICHVFGTMILLLMLCVPMEIFFPRANARVGHRLSRVIDLVWVNLVLWYKCILWHWSICCRTCAPKHRYHFMWAKKLHPWVSTDTTLVKVQARTPTPK